MKTVGDEECARPSFSASLPLALRYLYEYAVPQYSGWRRRIGRMLTDGVHSCVDDKGGIPAHVFFGSGEDGFPSDSIRAAFDVVAATFDIDDRTVFAFDESPTGSPTGQVFPRNAIATFSSVTASLSREPERIPNETQAAPGFAPSLESSFVQRPSDSTVGGPGNVIFVTDQEDSVAIGNDFLTGASIHRDAAVFPGFAVVGTVKDVLIVADDEKTSSLVVTESADHVMCLSAVE